MIEIIISILLYIFVASIIVFGLYMMFHTPRKESLNIHYKDNKLYFLLTDDDFLELNVKPTDNLYMQIESVITTKAKKISNFVNKVNLGLGFEKDEKFENKLLNIVNGQK